MKRYAIWFTSEFNRLFKKDVTQSDFFNCVLTTIKFKFSPHSNRSLPKKNVSDFRVEGRKKTNVFNASSFPRPSLRPLSLKISPFRIISCLFFRSRWNLYSVVLNFNSRKPRRARFDENSYHRIKSYTLAVNRNLQITFPLKGEKNHKKKFVSFHQVVFENLKFIFTARAVNLKLKKNLVRYFLIF